MTSGSVRGKKRRDLAHAGVRIQHLVPASDSADDFVRTSGQSEGFGPTLRSMTKRLMHIRGAIAVANQMLAGAMFVPGTNNPVTNRRPGTSTNRQP